MADHIPLGEAVAFIVMKTGLRPTQAETLLDEAISEGRVRATTHQPMVDVDAGGITWVDLAYDRRFAAKVEVHAADLHKWVRGLKGTGVGGRPPKADWEAYWEVFAKKCSEEGNPDKLNVKGWQTQADVVRFLSELVARDNADVEERTIREYARNFMLRAKTELDGGN
jgi:hypothetical protein